MPVNNPRFVDKAWTRGCDFIILDLEDSVPPAQKVHARSLIKEAIGTAAKGGAEVFVRINHDTIPEDLEGVAWPGLKRVTYPKAETAEEIRTLDEIITRLELERGIEPGFIEIGANVETALGVANAFEIASASPRIKDFGGGGGYDMSRDLGVEMFVDFDQFVYGKGELELATRVQGLNVHATPFLPNPSGSVSDGDYALRVAKATHRMGFRIGGGLHPNVVEPENRGFTPTPEEIADAHRVLELFAGLEDRGLAHAELDERTVDRYEASRARSVLEWADACAQRDADKLDSVRRAQEATGD